MNENSIMYSLPHLLKQIEFHEQKVTEYTLTNANPELLKRHKELLHIYKSARTEALISGEVDITEYLSKKK